MGTAEHTDPPAAFDMPAFYALLYSAHATGKALGALTGWLVAGMGATLAILFANIDKLAAMLDPSILQTSVKWYVAALGLHVLQRLLFIWSDAAVQASTGIAQLTNGKPLDQPHIGIAQLTPFFNHVRQFLHGPMRWLADAAGRDINSRGLASIGGFHTRLVNLQLLLVTMQLLLIGHRVWVLAGSLK